MIIIQSIQDTLLNKLKHLHYLYYTLVHNTKISSITLIKKNIFSLKLKIFVAQNNESIITF